MELGFAGVMGGGRIAVLSTIGIRLAVTCLRKIRHFRLTARLRLENTARGSFLAYLRPAFRAILLPHLLRRCDPKNTKTGRNDNGNGFCQSHFRMCCRSAALINKT